MIAVEEIDAPLSELFHLGLDGIATHLYLLQHRFQLAAADAELTQLVEGLVGGFQQGGGLAVGAVHVALDAHAQVADFLTAAANLAVTDGELLGGRADLEQVGVGGLKVRHHPLELPGRLAHGIADLFGLDNHLLRAA